MQGSWDKGVQTLEGVEKWQDHSSRRGQQAKSLVVLAKALGPTS